MSRSPDLAYVDIERATFIEAAGEQEVKPRHRWTREGGGENPRETG